MVDSDQTPHSMMSDLGLHCLLKPVCPNKVNMVCPNFLFFLLQSPDGVYSNIVTVTSSLDRSGLHQITHKMKNLKTRGTKTLVNDTVSARKVVTKLRSAN